MIKFHPVADLFPLLEGPEYEALKGDIQANGLREPVWTWKGDIIDGRNRYRACRELGLVANTQEWDGRGSLVAFVLSLNLHRRHLTQGQKAAVAVEIEPMLAKEAKERQQAAGERGKEGGRGHKKENPCGKISTRVSEPAPKARDEAASLVGTSGRYVSDAKAVKEKAPGLFEKVRTGDMTLPRAKAEVKRQEKREALEAKAKEAEQTAAAAPRHRLWRLIHGDCVTELGRLRDRPRLIFADPPYNVGVDYGDGEQADRLPADVFCSWLEKWVELCKVVLVEDGALWVLIGDEFAGECAVILKRHFTIRSWVKWYETFGVNCTDRFNRTSRHLFWCTTHPKDHVFHLDPVTRPSDRQTKYGDSRANPSGKLWDDVWQIPRLVGSAAERIPDFPTQLPLSLLTPIVLCSSDPGDLVLDPFSGSATAGVAAVTNGRRFIGIEKQRHFYDLAEKRLKGACP